MMTSIKIPPFREPDWQDVPEQVKWLHKKPYYVTERSGGDIHRIYRHNGLTGCSNPEYDKFAHELQLPEGICIYFEESPFLILVAAYHLFEKYFFSISECMEIAYFLKIPMATIVRYGEFDKKTVELESLGFDQVLVRSFDNYKRSPACFKVKYSNLAFL